MDKKQTKKEAPPFLFLKIFSIGIVFFILTIIFFNCVATDEIKEIKEDIKLCQEYCNQKIQEKGELIDKCVFEYQSEPTNVEHEEWELFHCKIYYKDGHTYGKFVGNL